MKRFSVFFLTVLLSALVLSACNNQTQHENTDTEPPAPPVTEQTPTPNQPEPPAAEKETQVICIDHLTVELVAAWEEGDRLLAELKSLSQLLKDSLLTQGYQVDEITITISTAGGFTADALNNGGIDLAFLPAVDYVTCADTITAVLTTDEDICTTVAAVNSLRKELDAAFCTALTQAILETDSGAAFLDTYQPGITCIPATDDTIQTVRDWVAEQEQHHKEG